MILWRNIENYPLPFLIWNIGQLQRNFEMCKGVFRIKLSKLQFQVPAMKKFRVAETAFITVKTKMSIILTFETSHKLVPLYCFLCYDFLHLLVYV